MKSYRIIISALTATAVLSSCAKDFISFEKTREGRGNLSLSVSADVIDTKAVHPVTDFPVEIADEEGNIVNSFSSVSEVPASLSLEVGTYEVISHSNGEIQRKMSAPYYWGSQSVLIMKGITTRAEIICTMLNSRIIIRYSNDFFDAFSSWRITLDDGLGVALEFTDKDSRTADCNETYWFFDGEVEEIAFDFEGYTKSGNKKITQKYIIKKRQASAVYEEGCDTFTGGDVLTFNLNPVASTTGKIQSMGVTADVSFEESEDNLVIDVRDADPTPDPDEPVGGEIEITLPSDIILPEPDLSKGDVAIRAENGFESIIVSITSTSEDMIASLEQVAEEYAGVDLINGCEVVGNTALVDFLAGLGQTITVPAKADKAYSFPVGNFFSFFEMLSGVHTVKLTVSDAAGNSSSGTVTVTVPEQ